MEPEAKALEDGDMNEAQVSIAISLKRIADELCGNAEHCGLVNGIIHAAELLGMER